MEILIIGSGIAGLSTAKAAVRQNPDAAVSIISQEKYPPYYRLRLCELIGKDIPFESFFINPVSWYKENKINLILSEKVLNIDTNAKKVSTSNAVYPFDALIITSGSIPVMPPFIGKELEGIYTLWNLTDITDINAALSNNHSGDNGAIPESHNAVVIGGGLLGLETAYHVRQMGIPALLVEGMPRLLPKQLDEEGSSIFRKRVESLDIKVITGQSVTEFKGSGGRVEALVLSDGQTFKTDVVVVSVGVRPDTSLCTNAGINTDRFIKVDEKMQTNIPGVYAAGDVASYEKQWFGLWSVADSQGQIAGTNAAGGNAIYQIQYNPYILNTMGTRIVTAGTVDLSADETSDIKRISEADTYSYARLDFKGNQLTGGVLMGRAAKGQIQLQNLIRDKAPGESIAIDSFLAPK